MADGEIVFQYVAVDASGRRVKGAVAAADDNGAFEHLKRDGLSPISIRSAAAGAALSERRSATLADRDLAALLSDLAALLRAGADMRTAFGILSSRGATAVRATARALSADITGGESLE